MGRLRLREQDDQSGPAWEAVQRARNLAAYIPGDFPNPQAEPSGYAEQRWNKVRIQLERAGRRAQYTGDTERGHGLPAVAFHQAPEILARDLNGLFGATGMLVAHYR